MPSKHPHVVALSGSLRDGSHTRTALQHAVDAAERIGATTDLIDHSALDVRVFDPDANESEDVEALRTRVAHADALLLGTPVYHGSYSSVLKTALDYCGRSEFEGKTVGLLAVAGGRFPVTTLAHLRTVCRSLGAWVLPHEVAIPNVEDAFDGDGEFTSDSLAERVDTLGVDAVRYASIDDQPSRERLVASLTE
ncbi:FMN reductase [Haloferax sp. MBLA0076]|uniref:FMN reductase n=1 Tax=Haloferax litoreum TaxID=2666140 RepID=A0A6A8GG42_9EURY|nr:MULTISPECIES: NADPH-dependent FMN reductase [Haloferax]KAB1193787.1 NAD(P)H-dependent oxidoreductase [Haloferax sp. CBA1148]MRX22324.1 FMN reductase [Haloferax litoreum]